MEVSEERLLEEIEAILRVADWDTITGKDIRTKLETKLDPDKPPGWLQPQKKRLKLMVDDVMQRVTSQSARAEATAPETEMATAAPEEASRTATFSPAPAAEAQSGPAVEAPAEENRPTGGSRPLPKEPLEDAPSAGVDVCPPPAAAPEGDGDIGEDDGGDDPTFLGEPLKERDGRIFYRGFVKWGHTYTVGTDVYLSSGSDEAEPYLARLMEVYAYAFAGDEVYFRARWWYREGDVRDYGLRDPAKERGLEAEEAELFYAIHDDENHADTVLRPAKVGIVQGSGSAPALSEPHEYFATRAYDQGVLYDITDAEAIAKNRLRQEVTKELTRQPDISGLVTEDSAGQPAAKKPRLGGAGGDEPKSRVRASYEELCSIMLARKSIEVRPSGGSPSPSSPACALRGHERSPLHWHTPSRSGWTPTPATCTACSSTPSCASRSACRVARRTLPWASSSRFATCLRTGYARPLASSAVHRLALTTLAPCMRPQTLLSTRAAGR